MSSFNTIGAMGGVSMSLSEGSLSITSLYFASTYVDGSSTSNFGTVTKLAAATSVPNGSGGSTLTNATYFGPVLAGVSEASNADATASLKQVDPAISTVTTKEAELGATQNQLSAEAANQQVSTENQTASLSSIRDLDMAAQASALARAQILVQSGQAMVSQANQEPQQLLRLLTG